MPDGDLFTDTRAWWRSWTWRSLLETVCLRGLEIARKPQTPSGAKLLIRIREEWEHETPSNVVRFR
jgi:hypothetical protein